MVKNFNLFGTLRPEIKNLMKTTLGEKLSPDNIININQYLVANEKWTTFLANSRGLRDKKRMFISELIERYDGNYEQYQFNITDEDTLELIEQAYILLDKRDYPHGWSNTRIKADAEKDSILQFISEMRNEMITSIIFDQYYRNNINARVTAVKSILLFNKLKRKLGI
jgi:hypothetical protein